MDDHSPRKLPPLNWIRAFEAAARCGSFAAAGRELGVTSAAIGQQIRLLEAQLGQPLFRRTAKGLVSTDLGQAYRPCVTGALEQLKAGTAEVFGVARRGRKGSLAGSLLLRAPVSMATLWLMPRLERFNRRYPEIALNVTTRAEPAAFGDDGIHVELRYGLGNWGGLRSERLADEYAFPVVGRPLAATPGWKILRDLPLLHVIGYRDNWPVWYRAAGRRIGGREPAIRFDSSLVALEAARRGLGVALGRWPMVADDLARGTLAAPFKVALPVAEAYHVVWQPGGEADARVQAFREFVLDEARRQKRPAWMKARVIRRR